MEPPHEDATGSYALLVGDESKATARDQTKSRWSTRHWLLVGCFGVAALSLTMLVLAWQPSQSIKQSVDPNTDRKTNTKVASFLHKELLLPSGHANVSESDSFLVPVRTPSSPIPLFCVRRSNVDKSFLIHQEIIEGPRDLLEELFALEYLRNVQQIFRFHDPKAQPDQIHDNDTDHDSDSDNLQLYREDPRENIPSQDRQMYRTTHFGERIASFTKIRPMQRGQAPAEQPQENETICFDALLFLQATVPFAMTAEQMNQIPPMLNPFASNNNGALLPDLNSLKIKLFPRNTMVVSSWIDLRLGEWSIAASFCLLPEKEMPKRLWDERVGFFAVRSKIENDPFPYTLNYIQRQRLTNPVGSDVDKERKKEIHEQKDRIVFFIDPSVPKHWHAVIKHGVLAWNEAFAPLVESEPESKSSQHQVIQCIAPGEPDFPQDFHSADVRFNVVSWVPKQDYGFSVTHFIVDPRSGEVLSAKIFMDSSHASRIFNQLAMEFVARQDDRNLHTAADILSAFQAQEPLVNASSVTLEQRVLLEQDFDASLLGSEQPHDQQQDNTGSLLRVFQDCMAVIVSHEIGHAFGLRHNFLGSTKNSFAQNGDHEFLRQHGISFSVMDYLPLNTRSSKTRGQQGKTPEDDQWFCQTRVGEYDKWAIRYGYSFDNSPSVLDEIASKRLPFQSDEDYIGNFSLVMQFDLGDNPLEFYQDQIQLVAECQTNLPTLAKVYGPVVPGQSKPLENSLWRVEKSLLNVLAHHYLGILRFVGGRQASRLHQHQLEVVPTPRARQLQALEILLDALSMSSKLGFLPNQQTSLLFVEKMVECDQGTEYLCHGGVKPDHEAFILHYVLLPVVKSLVDPDRLARIVTFSRDQNEIQLHELLDCCFAVIWNFTDTFVCGIVRGARKDGSKEVYSTQMLHTIQFTLVEQLVLAIKTAQNLSQVALEEQLLVTLSRFRSALNETILQQHVDDKLTRVHWKLTIATVNKQLLALSQKTVNDS